MGGSLSRFQPLRAKFCRHDPQSLGVQSHTLRRKGAHVASTHDALLLGGLLMSLPPPPPAAHEGARVPLYTASLRPQGREGPDGCGRRGR